MLQAFNILRQLFIFSNYMAEIDHFTLDLLKKSDIAGPSEDFLTVDHQKEDHNELEFKR